MSGCNEFTAKVSLVPGSAGVGMLLHFDASKKFPSVITFVEYLILYSFALLTVPSSPVAVHVKVNDAFVTLLVAKSVTAAGGVVSLVAVVVPTTIFEISDVLLLSSITLIANQYPVFDVKPVTIIFSLVKGTIGLLIP